MSQYGDASGSLSWMMFGETLTNALRNRQMKPPPAKADETAKE
jgi:hypothetical protein